VAPLPPIYIGFATFVLAYSDRNLHSVYNLLWPEPQLYTWAFGFVSALLYVNLVSRFRGSVNVIECIVMGAVVSFLLAGSYFAAVELEQIAPLPYMVFFPGIVLAVRDNWLLGTGILGAVLAPAGALSGWIFWRIGIAPALPKAPEDIF
jgi:hypothetical protein